MESVAIFTGLAVIGFFSLDNYLFEKFMFSLRDEVGISIYFDTWEIYRRAQNMLYRFPTQKKVDILIKFGILGDGAMYKKVDLISNGNASFNILFNSDSGKYNAIVNSRTNEILFLPDPHENMRGYTYLLSIDQSHGERTKKLECQSWSTPWGSLYPWRKYFDSENKSEAGKIMCRQIICLRNN